MMPSLPAGWRLIRYDSIGSTNDEAKRLAREGAAEGVLVWALEQTRGRARRGRHWVSPRGNLYLSLILRPRGSAEEAAQFGFVAALAVGDALMPLLPKPARLEYKWPNDVLVDGRKIAGILLESEMVPGERLAFVVVGVGVNLVSSPGETEYPATSLVEEGGAEVSPASLLEAFARHFDIWAACRQESGFAPIRAAWKARAAALGAQIKVRLDTVFFEGRFADIDEEGALLLENRGECRRVRAGEVFPVTV
jgi:BirA family biotin operon repressor/biotin-[acetyl-CoA-carboxylase] ligase